MATVLSSVTRERPAGTSHDSRTGAAEGGARRSVGTDSPVKIGAVEYWFRGNLCRDRNPARRRCVAQAWPGCNSNAGRV